MIDTGASHSAVTEAYAKRTGISRLKGNEIANAAFGQVQLSKGIAPDIAVGCLKILSFPVFIIPHQPDQVLDMDTGKPFVPAFDAIIGSDILMRFRSTIDFAARTIIFHSPDRNDFPEAGKVIARLESVPRLKIIIMKAKVDGLECWFKIDTGSQRYGSISEGSKLIGTLREVSVPPYMTWSLNNIRRTSTHLAAQMLRVDDLAEYNVEFAVKVKNPNKLNNGERELDGNLGSYLFINHGLVIDYARMEVRRGVQLDSAAIGREPSRELVEQPQ